MAVTAYLEAARVLRIDTARNFALLTLDRLLREAWDGEGSLSHVIAYGAGPSEGVEPPQKVPGTLDDYAFTLHACIDGWLANGEMIYYRAAVKLADAMIARFYDRTAGAYYDAAAQPPARRRSARWPQGVNRCKTHPRRPAIRPLCRPCFASRL